MKRSVVALLLFCFGMMSVIEASPAYASESGPGNGTDYVKVLFADAQLQISKLLAPVTDGELSQHPEITPAMQAWLLAPASLSPSGHQYGPGTNRFAQLKYFLRAMDLRFQNEPCSDATGLPASICFFLDDVQGPYVVISVDRNELTTADQAMAMLIHEAGHMTGESDHLWLDKVGVALVDSLLAPKFLTAQASTTDIVADIFTAKQDCEAGTSDQAAVIRARAQADILKQCSSHHLDCQVTSIQFTFQGTDDFVPGQGFDMKVTCAVTANLQIAPMPMPMPLAEPGAMSRPSSF